VNPEPFRIEPAFVPRIWGARSLAPLYPEKTNLPEPIGEVWLTGVDCKVATGSLAGKTLGEAWREMPPEWRSTDFSKASEFPLLIKFIFPTDKLSIQVHPDDAYAAAHEQATGGRGKTEMWHILSAEPRAKVLVGLKPGTTKEKFLTALQKSSLEELLEDYPVQQGDTIFVPAGTPHTIGPGMVLCEIQEYSDLTYRIYDYGRVDATGKPRDLHVKKALAVMNFEPRPAVKTVPLAWRKEKDLSLLAACKYFAVNRWEISAPFHIRGAAESFRLFVFLSGRGKFTWKEGSLDFHFGESWFVPDNLWRFSLLPDEPTSLLHIEIPYLPALVEQLEDSAGYSETDISRTVFAED
jgi:mannose-6-phosphate isomerase